MKKTKGKTRSIGPKKYNIIVIADGLAKVWRWEVSRKKVEGIVALSLTLLLVVTTLVWGFARYRQGYLATEEIRLSNAQFEQERAELLSKLSELEQGLTRTERLTSRLEGSLGLSSEEMQKGIGPLMENDMLSPASVREFDSLNVNGLGSKIALADLDLKGQMDELGGSISSVEDRLQTVYELHQDKLTYWASMPSIWPTRGWITSGFGPRRRPIRGGTRFHKGIDIASPPGTPVLAPGDGIVTFAGYKRGLGKTIIVDHGYGVTSVYGHNSKNYVKEGDRIRRGEIIAGVGRTGLATGSHLHYQIEVDGVPVDPMRYIHNKM